MIGTPSQDCVSWSCATPSGSSAYVPTRAPPNLLCSSRVANRYARRSAMTRDVTALAELDRVAVDPLPAVELIRERDLVLRAVEEGDVEVVRLEHLDQAIADEVDDRVEIELFGERLHRSR